MSTENVTEIAKKSAAANKASAKAVRDRAEAVSKALTKSLADQAQQAQDDAIVARLHAQVHADAQSPLVEEAGQLNGILGGNVPDDSSSDDAPQAPAPLAPVPVPDPEPVVVLQDPAPQAPTPQHPTGVLPAAPEPQAHGPRHLSNWRWWSWFLAIVFGVVALLIGVETRGFADDLPVVVEQIIKGMWIGGLTFFGAGVGGLLGTFFGSPPPEEN